MTSKMKSVEARALSACSACGSSLFKLQEAVERTQDHIVRMGCTFLSSGSMPGMAIELASGGERHDY